MVVRELGKRELREGKGMAPLDPPKFGGQVGFGAASVGGLLLAAFVLLPLQAHAESSEQQTAGWESEQESWSDVSAAQSDPSVDYPEELDIPEVDQSVDGAQAVEP